MSPTRRRERRTPASAAAPGARRRLLTGAAALSALAFAATACSAEKVRLGLPTPVTEQGKRVLTLWQGSWVAALAVGALVWGLIIWAVLFHRKRSDQLPPQVRYNLPIEMLYTVVPFIIVAVLFYFTARDETYLEKLTPASQASDVTVVNVTAFQWSWQFDYPQYHTAPIVGQPVSPDDPHKPTFEIPVGKKVRFHLVSKDVIHSFWVPSFIFKRDIIPGAKTGQDFEVTPTKTGTYEGRCAELCGVEHGRMLFQVKIVPQAEFDQFISSHKASGSTQ
ncbi:aa3-type cytochrome oxidase subunit II [Actinoallomurus iriomotensis]|uniref:aa3-type cytochrome oxidase subunit II n=1 Tax=Actinoallomurus TaxID=667113 RepID=UPI00255213A0|nr:cytochrome c oxidase subunit II [Actinoallomurus iriomotensis]